MQLSPIWNLHAPVRDTITRMYARTHARTKMPARGMGLCHHPRRTHTSTKSDCADTRPSVALASTHHHLALGPPACPSLYSKHSPKQLLPTHRTHSTQQACLSFGRCEERSLPSQACWKLERLRRGWELSSSRHLSHRKVTLSSLHLHQ